MRHNHRLCVGNSHSKRRDRAGDAMRNESLLHQENQQRKLSTSWRQAGDRSILCCQYDDRLNFVSIGVNTGRRNDSDMLWFLQPDVEQNKLVHVVTAWRAEVRVQWRVRRTTRVINQRAEPKADAPQHWNKSVAVAANKWRSRAYTALRVGKAFIQHIREGIPEPVNQVAVT